MASDEALDLLRSIDGSLKQLVAFAKARQGTPPKPLASDRELDSQYGNPKVMFNPRDWTGDSYKGRQFSECPAPFLEMIAETFDYFAVQAEEKQEVTTAGKPVAPYKRKDAERARGWAKRVREGHPSVTGDDAGEEWGGSEKGW
jgi:hypothetical protein